MPEDVHVSLFDIKLFFSCPRDALFQMSCINSLSYPEKRFYETGESSPTINQIQFIQENREGGCDTQYIRLEQNLIRKD